MPTINLDDDELAAVIATLRRVIEEDPFARAPRLDPLRAALAKLIRHRSQVQPPPAAKADKRPRR